MSAGYDNKGMDVGTSQVNIAGESQVKLSFKKEGPCDRRTKLEKGLIFLAVLFLLVLIGLIIALVLTKDSDEEKTQGIQVCETPDCTLAAAQLLSNMDLTVDPCDDFYTYSCGTWKKTTVIPQDRTEINVFSEVADNVEVIIKYLLEDTKAYPDVASIVKAKDLYASCLDLEKIEAKGAEVALPLLKELGGWPVLGSNPGGNWSESSFSLTQLLVSLNKYSAKPLINMHVGTDLKNTEKYIIYIQQSGLGLPGVFYFLVDELAYMREAYFTFAKTVSVLFGANETTADREMRDMLALEIDLANISMKPEELRDTEALYNKMNVSELKQNFAEPVPADPVQFDWYEFIRGVFDLEDVKIPINESEAVVVTTVPYFQKLFTVLQKHGKRTVANYVIWNIVSGAVSNMDSRFREAGNKLIEVVLGTSSATARWRMCTAYATSMFGMAVGHMFVKETFDETSKDVALDMISDIRNSFNELLDNLDWMDETTKGLAREKAAAIREWIGYPNDILDTKQVDKQWSTAPSTVNAYYSGLVNAIMFPAGILQPPFYDKGRPKSMNYGAIGVVIGHEITHGFDDKGRQFDKNGDLKEWWSSEIIQKFKNQTQCMIDQYSRYKVTEVDLNVNGRNTLGENIADNGGLKQSFRAYRKWVAEQGREEPMLPGVNFTNNQLFFISFAQVWCSNVRNQGLFLKINTGVHSPGRFRVIGPLQNSADFSEAFGCKKNDYMNPENKCYVW